jgi:hypothetical protein
MHTHPSPAATSAYPRLGLAACGLCLALGMASLAQAQESNDELAAKATDPTASLMSFQLNDWYTARLHGSDDSANQIVLRAAIPFSLLGANHIFRITQPYATSTPSGATGLVDTTIFDLVTFNQPWGRWGVGITATMPTGANGLSTDKWTAGPALGFVNSSAKTSNWGLFAQSFFSFAGNDSAPGVRLVNLQPILSYQLGEGRSISLGNSAIVYDLVKSRWSSLMLSANYGQVISFWGQKWRPNVEAGYDFNNDFGNQRWVLRAGMTLLVPSL